MKCCTPGFALLLAALMVEICYVLHLFCVWQMFTSLGSVLCAANPPLQEAGPYQAWQRLLPATPLAVPRGATDVDVQSKLSRQS